MFSQEKEGGVPVALIIDVDQDGKQGDDDGKIIYLHKANGVAIDDFDDAEYKAFKGGQTTQEEPDRDVPSRKRDRFDAQVDEEEVCDECGTPEDMHSRDGECPSRAVAREYETKRKLHSLDTKHNGSGSGAGAPKPPRGPYVRDESRLTPYDSMGEKEFFSGREGRSLKNYQRQQLRTARGPDPHFEAPSLQQLTFMQRKYQMALQEQKEKTGGKSVTLK